MGDIYFGAETSFVHGNRSASTSRYYIIPAAKMGQIAIDSTLSIHSSAFHSLSNETLRSLHSICQTKEPHRFIPEAFHIVDNRDLAIL